MTGRYRLLLFGLIVMTGGSAEARTVAPRDEADMRSHRVILVDDAMDVAVEADDWRLRTESFAPPAAEEDALRMKVKVRPNRAMGRMSLSF